MIGAGQSVEVLLVEDDPGDEHANAYVTKPVDVNQFIAAVRQIDDFFLSVVRLPHH